VFSLTFRATSRWIVSALAPGVNGMMMLIGRDDSSSAAAGSLPITAASRAAGMIHVLRI
jgi:hypothetical protein